MKNYVQNGRAITVSAPSAVNTGDGVLVGGLFGIASGDADAGQKLTLATTGVFEVPKATTDEIAVGDVVNWDSAAGEATVASADAKIGHAVAAAGNPSGTVEVRLSV
jgi:predicted RecA/RadA family phage recombinase